MPRCAPASAHACFQHLALLLTLCELQPDNIETSNLQAWYYDDNGEDQRLPHRFWLRKEFSASCYIALGSRLSVFHMRSALLFPCRRNEPNESASLDSLRDLGVLYWNLDADQYESDPKLRAIRDKRGYSYQVSNTSKTQTTTCKQLCRQL